VANPLKTVILTALFAGTGAAGGYLLMAVPNVEVLTLIMFLSGYTLGARQGVTASIIAALLYFGFNPQGGMFPPLLIAQIVGLTAAPVAGALFNRISHSLECASHPEVSGKPAILPLSITIRQSLLLSAMAIAATFWYDLLTNLAFPLATGMGINGVITVLIAGIPFSVLHIVSNVLIFIFIIPPLLILVKRYGLVD